jgi:choline-sulfatase
MKRLLLAPAVLLLCAAGPVGSAKTNVLLISIDALRADRVTPELMPRLHALGVQGLSFRRAYAHSTWTLPSHATMLGGRYPAEHGAGGSPRKMRRMRDGGVMLAEILADRGWTTASLVNVALLSQKTGVTRGFDFQTVSPGFQDNLAQGGNLLVALRKPAFVFVHSYMVHDYTEYIDDKAPECVRAPVRPTRECGPKRTVYDKAVRCADRELGALFDRLKAAGLWDDLMVLVTADHGESLCDGPSGARNGHGWFPYEEVIRVPLLIKLPRGRRAGEFLEGPALLVDTAPTVLDALGLPPEPTFSGKSLLGRPPDPNRLVRFEGDNFRGVSQGGWKFVEVGRHTRLYNLQDDPTEAFPLTEPSRESMLRAVLGPEPTASVGAPITMPREALRAAGYLP